MVALAGGCVVDDEANLSENESAILGANKLGANKLGANKLGANKLGANKLGANSLETQQLMSTSDGRDVMGFIVGCALPTGQSITAQDPNGVSYTFPGWLNLAPAWATRAPTVAERHWVTACLLARTNVFGIPVNISMRHDTYLPLTSSASERAAYPNAEGAFYGDIFAPIPALFACSNRPWTTYQLGTFRACALATGSTTDCNFTYTGSCSSSTCFDKVAPFGSCSGQNTTYSEVITIFLTATQQQGGTQ